MGCIGKGLALALILIMTIAAVALLIVKPAFAQTPTSTPFPTTYSSTLAIPEFTVQKTNRSYDVPPTATTTYDPYTGSNITSMQPGYHVENDTIDFIVTNQPHVSVFVQLYYGIDLYYDIRFKGHFGDTWTELRYYDGDENLLLTATNSTYTLISIQQSMFPSNGSVDFQMRAINGTIHSEAPGVNQPFAYWTYESSGWSNIETLNMTDGSVSIMPFTNPTPNPTPSPSPLPTASPPEIQTPTSTSTSSPAVPELTSLTILPLLLSVFSVAVTVKHRKQLT